MNLARMQTSGRGSENPENWALDVIWYGQIQRVSLGQIKPVALSRNIIHRASGTSIYPLHIRSQLNKFK